MQSHIKFVPQFHFLACLRWAYSTLYAGICLSSISIFKQAPLKLRPNLFHISTVSSVGGETNNCYDLQDNTHMQYTVVRFVIDLSFD